MKRLFVALLALPLILGCGTTDSTSPDNASIAGTWELRTVNGTALPYVVPTSATTSNTLMSRVLTMANDGTYSEVTTIEIDNSSSTSTTTTTELGTWSALNGYITFDDQTDGLTYTASVSGNTLTENYQNFTSVYTRR